MAVRPSRGGQFVPVLTPPSDHQNGCSTTPAEALNHGFPLLNRGGNLFGGTRLRATPFSGGWE
jgi:hypothetical protein